MCIWAISVSLWPQQEKDKLMIICIGPKLCSVLVSVAKGVSFGMCGYSLDLLPQCHEVSCVLMKLLWIHSLFNWLFPGVLLSGPGWKTWTGAPHSSWQWLWATSPSLSQTLRKRLAPPRHPHPQWPPVQGQNSRTRAARGRRAQTRAPPVPPRQRATCQQ